MKIYFYFLNTVSREMGMEECEAKEKKKIYKILGDSPFGYPRKIVDKEDVGKLLDTFPYYIILKEENVERAVKVFTNICKGDIYRAERKIKIQEGKIDMAELIIKNIEKWRSENAGK